MSIFNIFNSKPEPKKSPRRGGRKAIPLSQDNFELALRLRREGLSWYKIVRQMPKGISLGVLRSRVDSQAHGIPHDIRKQRLSREEDWPNIVRMREEKKTYVEIARAYNITRERVRQIIEINRPDLTGYISQDMHCAACDIPIAHNRSPEGGDFAKNTSGPDRDLLPNLCLNKCWPVFHVYRRFRRSFETYGLKYAAIKKQQAAGVQISKVGKILAPNTSPAGQQVYPYRVFDFYKSRKARLQGLEAKHPWIKPFYESWINGLSQGKVGAVDKIGDRSSSEAGVPETDND